MIAVTGANGLVGSFLIKELVQQNQAVAALMRQNSSAVLLGEVVGKIARQEADILDMPSLLKALAHAQTVVHAAGMVSFNPRKRHELFKINVEGTRNVVDACLKLGIPRLIHVSSVAALGRTKETLHITEENKWVPSTHNTFYAESKYQAELEVYRGMEEGLHVSLVNPSVILAPVATGQSSSQIFSYVQNQSAFYSAGVMNYVDVRDVAEMIIQLLQTDFNGERFIASAGLVPLKEMFDGIATRLERRAPFVKVPAAWVKSVAVLEELKAYLLGKEPRITRQSAKILEENYQFVNTKAVQKLGIQFKKLEETLNWCCSELQREIQ